MVLLRRFRRFGAGDVVALELAPECGESLVPDAAVRLEPAVDLGERLDPQPARPALRVAAARHEAGLLEHADVLRDGALRQVEGRGELGDGCLTDLLQASEDRSPRRIGEGLERTTQRVGHVSYQSVLELLGTINTRERAHVKGMAQVGSMGPDESARAVCRGNRRRLAPSVRLVDDRLRHDARALAADPVQRVGDRDERLGGPAVFGVGDRRRAGRSVDELEGRE